MKPRYIPTLNSSDLAAYFLTAYSFKSLDIVLDLFDDNAIYRDNFHKLGGKVNLKLFFESFFAEEFTFKCKEIQHREDDALANFDFTFGDHVFSGQVLLNFNESNKITLMWVNFS